MSINTWSPITGGTCVVFSVCPTLTVWAIRFGCDNIPLITDDTSRYLGDARVDGLVPEESAARHVVDDVLPLRRRRFAHVEQVAVLWVRLPDLAHREVTLIAVDGCR